MQKRRGRPPLPSKPTLAEAIRHSFRLEGEAVVRISAGREVRETPGSDGYCKVSVKVAGRSRPIGLHRVKFCLAYGWLPENVDHKNRIRSDNRLANLRPATGAQNAANRTGTLGVRRQGKGWMAYAHRDNRQVYLGTHLCFGHAVRASAAARRSLHGEFAGGHTTAASRAP